MNEGGEGGRGQGEEDVEEEEEEEDEEEDEEEEEEEGVADDENEGVVGNASEAEEEEQEEEEKVAADLFATSAAQESSVAGALETSGDTVEDMECSGLEEALRRSERCALDQENADVAEAILRSKGDKNSDSIDAAHNWILARLTNNSPEIRAAILGFPALGVCLDCVDKAGCEVQPDWANGALLLVPLTKELVDEVGIELKAHNVVLLPADYEHVRQALSKLPHRKRPQLKEDVGGPASSAANFGSDATKSLLSIGEFDASLQNVALEVVDTFLSYRVPKDISETSNVAQSAPCAFEHVVESELDADGFEQVTGPPGCSKRTNPRHWGSLP